MLTTDKVNRTHQGHQGNVACDGRQEKRLVQLAASSLIPESTTFQPECDGHMTPPEALPDDRSNRAAKVHVTAIDRQPPPVERSMKRSSRAVSDGAAQKTKGRIL